MFEKEAEKVRVDVSDAEKYLFERRSFPHYYSILGYDDYYTGKERVLPYNYIIIIHQVESLQYSLTVTCLGINYKSNVTKLDM